MLFFTYVRILHSPENKKEN